MPHLDAHKRVLSVAAVQKHLHASGATGSDEVAPYLNKIVRESCDFDDWRYSAYPPEGGR
jgi:hypothetical protein